MTISDSINEALAEIGGIGALEEEHEEAEEPVATPGEGEPSKGEPTSTEDESEPVVDGEADEVPTDYWGVPLDGIAPEKVREIIAHFEQQDSTIRKLQAELAKEPEAPEPASAPATPEDISDEDLLTAAGYDPEDYEVQQMAKFLLPSLRRELALEDQLSALIEKDQRSTVEHQWNSQLDELESRFGKLPFERRQVLAKAAQEGIASPFELYAQLYLPVKAEVEKTVAEARRETLKREAAGSLKPTTSGAGTPPITSDMSLRDAVKAAAEAAEKETGVSWRSVFKKRQSPA